MFVPDTTEIFPECPSFGFTSGPRYKVKIIEREGGYERRTRKWARPLHRYSGVPMGQRMEEDVQNVLYFWHAVGGPATGFRFMDYADYKSCKTFQTPTPLDQPLSFEDDTSGSYQLVKEYSVGSLTQIREIYKPIASTIRVANESGVEQPASAWTIYEATGLLVPDVSFTGTPTSWGGEFYVYARFDSEFDVEIVDKAIQGSSFSIAEIRIPRIPTA